MKVISSRISIASTCLLFGCATKVAIQVPISAAWYLNTDSKGSSWSLIASSSACVKQEYLPTEEALSPAASGSAEGNPRLRLVLVNRGSEDVQFSEVLVNPNSGGATWKLKCADNCTCKLAPGRLFVEELSITGAGSCSIPVNLRIKLLSKPGGTPINTDNPLQDFSIVGALPSALSSHWEKCTIKEAPNASTLN